MHLSGYILAVTAKNTPALRERRDIAIRHFDDVNQMFPLDRVAELLASVSCSCLVGWLVLPLNSVREIGPEVQLDSSTNNKCLLLECGMLVVSGTEQMFVTGMWNVSGIWYCTRTTLRLTIRLEHSP